MARTNKTTSVTSMPMTHENTPAAVINAEEQLRRVAMASMMWESQFYVDGEDHASVVERACKKLIVERNPAAIAAVAVEARDSGLRHLPLYLCAVLDVNHKGDSLVRDTVYSVVRRADEPAEMLAMAAQVRRLGPDKLKKAMSNGMRKGIARAFTKFDGYQLAKYDRNGPVKMRDAVFLTHVKPHGNRLTEDVLKKLVDKTLPAPDTWEVALSIGGNKKTEFERLLKEGKMGYMAVLRNLRNMDQAGVSRQLISKAILDRKGAENVLPFRYFAASKATNGKFDFELNGAFLGGLRAAGPEKRFKGKTIVVVDVSGSMWSPLSGKSDLTRQDAASSVAAILKELCEDCRIYATGSTTVAVDSKREGMDLIRYMERGTGAGGGGIFTHKCMGFLKRQEGGADRVIIITDEQDCGGRASDPKNAPTIGTHNYMINVGAYKNGIGYGKWFHIDGFSERVLDYILSVERIGDGVNGEQSTDPEAYGVPV